MQGHINFPMILNLSPFVKCEAGIQKREMDKPKSLGEQPDLANTSHLKSADRHPDLSKQLLSFVTHLMLESIHFKI